MVGLLSCRQFWFFEVGHSEGPDPGPSNAVEVGLWL